MNPWQYEHGVCNNDNNDAPRFCKWKQFVVLATNNCSRAHVNKPFVAINTAKCGTEDVAWELSHCSHYYYWSWSNRNTVAWNSNPFYGCYIIENRQKLGHIRVVLSIQTLRLSQHSINSIMPLGYDNFNSSCTQKSHQILVPRLASVPHKPPKTIGHRRSKWLELYFCLLLAETRSSRSQWYPFWSSDIPTSQSALKQSYTEKTNGQNNDDTAKSLHSAAIQFP